MLGHVHHHTPWRGEEYVNIEKTMATDASNKQNANIKSTPTR